MLDFARIVNIIACSIGLDKGGIPGVAAFGMTFAISEITSIPIARTLASLVPVLFCADIGAAFTYRHAVNWSILWNLFPSIVTGLLVGFCCLGYFSDEVIKVSAGCILLLLAALHFSLPYFRQVPSILPHGLHHDGGLKPILPKRLRLYLRTLLFGLCIGTFTVLANIAGPIAVIYLMQRGVSKNELNATRSVLFVLVNCLKIPCQVFSGNLDISSAIYVTPLIVLSVLSTVLTARYVLPYVQQQLFERLAWSFVLIGGVKLILCR